MPRAAVLSAALCFTTLAGLLGAVQVEPPAAGPIPTDPWPAWPPPPLRRSKPKQYTVGLAIDVGATSQLAQVTDPFTSTGGRLTIEPVIADPWTVADLDRCEIMLRMNGSPVAFDSQVEGDPNADHRRIAISIPDGQVNALSLRASWPAIAFNSEVDESAASSIAWPRAWTSESQSYLSPSLGIDSDHQIFRDFVAKVAGEDLRRVPVYLAAKDLVRRSIIEFSNVSGEALVREGLGAVRGFRLQGASMAANAGTGSRGDLVCVSVAVLRAAGIPARPVIGIYSGKGSRSDNKLPSGKSTLCVWAEFHLPGAGWVPFDPFEMRGSGLPQADVRKPWRWFGTIDQLNERVALTYEFAPVKQGFIQDWPAGWSWTISGVVRAPFRIVDVTTPILVSHGSVPSTGRR
jgi:transglutaminase-like putative cysteine protease